MSGSHAFAGLSTAALAALAGELESERLQAPYYAAGLIRHVSPAESDAAATALSALSVQGFSSRQIGTVLRLIVRERFEAQRIRDRVELVWSGPEEQGSGTRDTAVVVRELFAAAEESVLITTFAIY